MARRYPQPPALIKRILLHCFVPESWPMAARYPSRYTLVALLLAILIAALAAGIGDGVRFARDLDAYAGRFQTAYPEAPLEISKDGKLQATAAFREPISLKLPSFSKIIADPTGKTSPESLKEICTLISATELTQCGTDGPIYKVPYNLGPQDSVIPITGAAIRSWSVVLAWLLGALVTGMLGLGNIAWAAVTMFLICPLVMVIAAAGEKPLIMPRRAAYRMCGAFLIPLVIFGGLMHGAGYSLAEFWGGQNAMLFWFFTAGAMAIWTGFMAKKIFAPPAKNSRGS